MTANRYSLLRSPRTWALLLVPLLLASALWGIDSAMFAPAPAVSTTAQARVTHSESVAVPVAHTEESPAKAASVASDADALMPALSADLRGRRSDLQLRQGYARRLLHESDLASFARELAALAAAGDGAAAAALSQLYDVCARDGEYTGGGPTRCDGLGQAAPTGLRAASKAWLQVARRLGDPASVLRVDYFDSPLPGVPPTREELRLRAAATELFADGDYDALLDAALMLHELSDRYDSRAIEWALCTVRLACPIERPQCRNVGRCMFYQQASAPNFSQLTSRQSRVIAGQRDEIVRALQRGEFDALWRPLDLGEGG